MARIRRFVQNVTYGNLSNCCALLFSNPLPKNRSGGESLKSALRFDLRDPPIVWIIRILDSENSDLDFPKQTYALI